MTMRYLIIGTGVASLAAAETIRRQDPVGTLTVIGDDPDGYYSRPGLAYYLNKTIPEQQLFPRAVADLRELYTRRIHARVTALLPERHEIILQNGQRESYDRLLLATGARPTPFPFPGDNLAGIVKLDTLQNVRDILELARRGRSAVVIGGGVIGIELAEGLAAHGVCVHHFIRRDKLWSVLDETETRLVQRGLEEKGVQLHFQTELAQAIGEGGRLAAVVTKTGTTLPCQILGLTVGVTPDITLAKQAGLATSRGVLVNEYMETSAPDILAAGNVAQVRNPQTGDTWLETLWATARLQGQVAGANMTGDRMTCTKPVPFNVVRIGGITATAIGAVDIRNTQELMTVTLDDGEIFRESPEPWTLVRTEPVNRVRVLLNQQQIVGAVLLGANRLARPLHHAIEYGADLSEIHALLSKRPERELPLWTKQSSEWERAYVAA